MGGGIFVTGCSGGMVYFTSLLNIVEYEMLLSTVHV